MKDTTLLIVGAGELGGRVGRLWKQQFPQSRVIAETRSRSRHDTLADWGMDPRVSGEGGMERIPNVLFAVPPLQGSDQTEEVSRATKKWSNHGRFVLVSSTAVFAEQHGGLCVEDSPLSDSDRATALLKSEEKCLLVQGDVVRMAGLYAYHRGPHRMYMRSGQSSAPGNGLVNLIHYDDAATLCLQVLLSEGPERIYLGSDNHPLTREELARSAWQSGQFGPGKEGGEPCTFAPPGEDVGRRCNNVKTKRALNWEPRHTSFHHWLLSLKENGD